ncbi:hypothetical protein JXA40_07690 [bacterium]|nr:hypothetical protein [candidate division CSSED10-310 bacterium]
MKKILSTLMIALMFGSIAFAGDKPQEKPAVAPGEGDQVTIQFGSAERSKNIFTLQELMANPDQFVGKDLTTKGTVVEGCHHSGMWIRISHEGVTLDVYSGSDWKFPTEHKGMIASVSGTLKSKILTGDELKAHIDHLNREHDGKMKVSDYPEGLKYYTLTATGATLKGTKKETIDQASEDQVIRPGQMTDPSRARPAPPGKSVPKSGKLQIK